jgi:phosphate transport system permease protein
MSYKQIRLWKDRWSSNFFLWLCLFFIFIVVLIGAGLFIKSAPIWKEQSIIHLIFSKEWKPFQGKFGFLAYISGSLLVTFLAVIIGLPISLMSAVYISEYAPQRLKSTLLPLIDLLSGIPPIVYGVWGVLTIVPLVGHVLAPRFGVVSSGYSALTGGIVLAVMIFPLLIRILLDVFEAVPSGLKDASLSLGANQWETVRHVLLKRSAPGIVAATILALSRALGETIAVLMVCGNIAALPKSIFDSVYPLPALIANNYGDMLSIPQYDAALMLAAFILFVLIFLCNALSRMVLNRLERRNYA